MSRFVFVVLSGFLILTGLIVVTEPSGELARKVGEVLRESILAESNETSFNGIVLLLGVTSGALALTAIFISSFRVVRSTSEKAQQEVVSRFDAQEKILRLKIEVEKDAEKREELRKQALALRQEYESLLSENLQRKDGSFVSDWREVLLVARKRLANEEQRLRARNVANLVIGITSLSLGVILLIGFLRSSGDVIAGYSAIDFFVAYWARIGIVLTIGIFAGFFLRLYSITERAIERNKNEITNIELRLAAGLMLSKKTAKTKFDSLANDLAKEERNFILDKNQSSALSDSSVLPDYEKVLKAAIKIVKAGG